MMYMVIARVYKCLARLQQLMHEHNCLLHRSIIWYMIICLHSIQKYTEYSFMHQLLQLLLYTLGYNYIVLNLRKSKFLLQCCIVLEYDRHEVLQLFSQPCNKVNFKLARYLATTLQHLGKPINTSLQSVTCIIYCGLKAFIEGDALFVLFHFIQLKQMYQYYSNY